MGTYMSTVNSVLENFNQYFKVKVDGLKTRGESIDDSMVNLFKAYHVASDTEFFCYIKKMEDSYNEDEYIAPDQLVNTAIKKYEVLLTSGK